VVSLADSSGTLDPTLKVDLSATAANATAIKVDGSAVTQPVSGTFFQATQPVSGTVTANAGSGPATAWKVDLANTGANATAIKVDNSAVTQPVSGTVTVQQGTGTNLHTVVDSGALTANQGSANATPWNQNVSQFGGSAVVTGTGTSGVGSFRLARM
jgi:hypothetical protein